MTHCAPRFSNDLIPKPIQNSGVHRVSRDYGPYRCPLVWAKSPGLFSGSHSYEHVIQADYLDK